ncbi:hypothetical protein ETD86_23460 [Nonomuraea turkmeniaca]|uniref:Uncharacterized protein n=1 Tax=Nonomuraea turkmeniaca TaxID=103838 RepID=A0A5S4FG43_9ACTN|nr:hypothetical protein [Nonomuraea turkmeniaca]TMR17361.1 hypothetical protein ETD86_23460 [Nonomuraea turkmeniaca]
MLDRYGRERTGLPRWVKLAALVTVVVSLVIVVMAVTGVFSGGGHTPPPHISTGGPAPRTHTPPTGGHQ